MKKVLKSVLTLTILSTMLVSCTDEQNLLIVAAKGEYAILSPTTGAAVTLDAATTSNPGLSLTWAKADYGTTPTVVNYSIEVDKSGDNFDTPLVLTTSTTTFANVNSEALNTAALAIGLTPFQQGSMDIRISASVGSPASDVKLSNTINYLVTPYSTDLPKLYVTGSFLPNSGYGSNTPANGVPIAAASFTSTAYEGFVYINQPNYSFVFLPTNTSSDGKYGDDGNFSNTLALNGADITGTGANYYYVKANTTTLTYSLQPTQWAITGAATPLGWPDNGVQDQNMTYNPTTKKWEITLAMTAGGNQFKFRANDGWDVNLGKDGGDADESMDFGGENLDVPAAGTYKIELDLSSPRNYTWTATLQ
jgi:hypothetical protein